MKSSHKTVGHGFTLVELLVVIAIIATLASVSLSIIPRMLRRAKSAESLEHLHQFAPLLLTYATDHSMNLPAATNNQVTINGVSESLTWSEVCTNQLFPSATITNLKDPKWWKQSKPFLINPLFKTWTPQAHGYAWNEMIAVNTEEAKSSDRSGTPLEVAVPLVSIPEPGRTPLIVPAVAGRYRLDVIENLKVYQSAPASELLVDGRFSVLFVDGHLESMTPKEYYTRQFFSFPKVSAP
jgi:prepilin-type N-terminal cleavage/methylation domain-containing protein/prepilin-type processing-associated H-X9-DG protein